MDKTKNYYKILGLLPSAEDFLIRAAYKALAQRYHPDKYSGSKEDANLRMAEINEAYTILSDSIKKREYDALRQSNMHTNEPEFDNQPDAQESAEFNSMDDDWNLAIEYYPDLTQIVAKLKKINWRLANSYRIHLLSKKEFDKRFIIADTMKREFLITYFGNNERILTFAVKLITLGDRSAVRDLNKAVRIFGDNIDADRVIAKLSTKFKNGTGAQENHEFEPQKNKSCPYCHTLIYESADYCLNCHKHI